MYVLLGEGGYYPKNTATGNKTPSIHATQGQTIARVRELMGRQVEIVCGRPVELLSHLSSSIHPCHASSDPPPLIHSECGSTRVAFVICICIAFCGPRISAVPLPGAPSRQG